MSDVITLRTRKVLTNRLLARKQMVVEITHPSLPSVPNTDIKEKLASLYKSTTDLVFLFGFRRKFGGGKSAGFANIYDSLDAAKKFEARPRLIASGATQNNRPLRSKRKVKKNITKKLFGVPKKWLEMCKPHGRVRVG